MCNIMEVSKPKTKKDLISFLGAVAFYRKFIDRFAGRATSLTDMTRKGEPNVLKWSKSADETYLVFKSKISEHPVLRLPNGQVTRWALAMQKYRYAIRSVKGTANQTADFLSRCSAI